MGVGGGNHTGHSGECRSITWRSGNTVTAWDEMAELQPTDLN